MAGDIEALKKGAPPSMRTVTITPVPVQPTTTLTPKPKEETAARVPTEPTLKIKPVFPKIPDTNLKAESPLLRAKDITPSDQTLMPPRPFRPQVNEPFNAPISKPMPPMEPKNITPPPRSTPPEPTRPMPPIPPPPKFGPVLPPLPPLPKIPLASARGRSFNKRLLILAVLVVALIVFIIGEIWWFFLRTPGAPPPEVATEQTTDTLPPPQELTPLLPADEIQPIASEPALPESILSYDRTEIIIAENDTPSVISAAIKSFDIDSINSGELVRLTIKTTESDGPNTSELATLDDVIKGLGLRIPQNVRQNLSGDFDFFIFGANSFDKDECLRLKNTAPSCYGPRLGLAAKISESNQISSVLKSWEKTMVTDLKQLILAKSGTAASVSFLTGTYRGQTIRYKNLPLNTVTAEYVLADDILIIATSKSSMLKAVDSLNSNGNSNEPSE